MSRLAGPIRLGVLISGGGRTLVNLHEQIEEGRLDAQIDVVVSSRADVIGVERSRRLGLNTKVIDRQAVGAADFDDQLAEAVADVELVCMAGFLCLWRIPVGMIGRVVNIHPALLPLFGGKGMYGRRVHEAVLASGVTQTGCTVHFCDNQYDNGPIILRREVPVEPNDTVEQLAARVFREECIAYPQAIGLIADGSVRLTAREGSSDPTANLTAINACH